MIGFVGLIAPHVTRMIVGSDYRYMIPVSSLVGALLLLLSDTVGRNIIAPTQLPVGIITSVIGVPFFLYLIIRKRGDSMRLDVKNLDFGYAKSTNII